MIRQTIPAMKRHNKEVSQAIGNRLYRRRKELRLSGADVALLAGVHYRTYKRIEGDDRFTPKLSTLIPICDVLGLSLDDLFEGL